MCKHQHLIVQQVAPAQTNTMLPLLLHRRGCWTRCLVRCVLAGQGAQTTQQTSSQHCGGYRCPLLTATACWTTLHNQVRAAGWAGQAWAAAVTGLSHQVSARGMLAAVLQN
jgi:hypothetical protein